MKSLIVRRVPPYNAVLSVFAVIAFLIFGRSLYVFAYKIPSWLTFLTVGEILSTLAYGLVFNLLESLFVLFCLLAVAFILPGRWFREVFVPSSTWFILVLAAAVFQYFKRYASLGSEFLSALPLWMLVSVGVAVLVGFLGGRIRYLSVAANWLSDRLIVFLYLFAPASLLSMLVVVVRNIF